MLDLFFTVHSNILCSIIKTDIEKCQTLLRYLKRFLSADEIEKHPKLQKYIRGISGTPDKDDELREETEKGGEAEIMADYGGENGEENGMAHADENGMENGHENGIDEEENKGNGKGKAKHKENKKKDEDLDYLSSSMFLTDDDEGHFYEKDKEDDNSRKTKKKKTKPKQQKVNSPSFLPLSSRSHSLLDTVLPGSTMLLVCTNRLVSTSNTRQCC